MSVPYYYRYILGSYVLSFHLDLIELRPSPGRIIPLADGPRAAEAGVHGESAAPNLLGLPSDGVISCIINHY